MNIIAIAVAVVAIIIFLVLLVLFYTIYIPSQTYRIKTNKKYKKIYY